MMKRSGIFAAFASVTLLATSGLAGNSAAGPSRLLCATVDARDCVRGSACVQGLAEEIGAPRFIRVDLERQVLVGPKRTTPILAMEQDEQQLLLQGKELGHAWVFALDKASGSFSGTLTSHEGAFVLFGNCVVP